MLFCCNNHFAGSFSRILFNTELNYRRIEFGICPVCGCLKFRDYKIDYSGKEKVNELSGKAANDRMVFWRKRLKSTKQGSWTKQNIYYGDFRKTRKKDEFGNPIYLQLRRNFNNEAEIIGEVRTRILLP